MLKDTTLQSYEADKVCYKHKWGVLITPYQNNKPVKEARDEFNLTTWKFEKNIKAKPNKARPYIFRMVDSSNNKFFLLATNTEAEMVTWLTKTMNVFYFVCCPSLDTKCSLATGKISSVFVASDQMPSYTEGVACQKEIPKNKKSNNKDSGMIRPLLIRSFLTLTNRPISECIEKGTSISCSVSSS